MCIHMCACIYIYKYIFIYIYMCTCIYIFVHMCAAAGPTLPAELLRGAQVAPEGRGPGHASDDRRGPVANRFGGTVARPQGSMCICHRSYHITTSYRIMSDRIISCHLISCDILSYRILSYRGTTHSLFPLAEVFGVGEAEQLSKSLIGGATVRIAVVSAPMVKLRSARSSSKCGVETGCIFMRPGGRCETVPPEDRASKESLLMPHLGSILGVG